jgi:hypothetical protein
MRSCRGASCFGGLQEPAPLRGLTWRQPGLRHLHLQVEPCFLCCAMPAGVAAGCRCCSAVDAPLGHDSRCGRRPCCRCRMVSQVGGLVTLMMNTPCLARTTHTQHMSTPSQNPHTKSPSGERRFTGPSRLQAACVTGAAPCVKLPHGTAASALRRVLTCWCVARVAACLHAQGGR